MLFLILTASRTSEVIGAKWNEFNQISMYGICQKIGLKLELLTQ